MAAMVTGATVSLAAVATLSAGCSTASTSAAASDASLESGTDDATDAATDTSSGADAHDADAAQDVVSATDVSLDPTDDTTNFNDCTPFDFASNDHTASGDLRVIAFPVDPAPAQYQPRCMKIRATQTITWRGDFRYHPLGPAGGDVPTPITVDPSPSGSERAIAFPSTGFFGFECVTHEAPLMYGAVLVVP
jgi:plastocyanin